MVQGKLKGEHLHLHLIGWGSYGDTLAYHGESRVMVFGGIPGERVVAEVVKPRKGYLAAQVVQVLEPSPHRVAPPCGYFGTCTGCQWQHIDYQHQLDLKRDAVAEALVRLGGFRKPLVEPTIPSPQQYGYRNHARFTVHRDGSLGYVHRESRRFVPIQECLLMHPLINRMLGQIQNRCGETTQLSLRAGETTGDYLIQPLLKSPEVPVPSGQKHYLEALGGRSFRIAASSFFQVNIPQTEGIVALVREGLQLSGEGLLLDSYAGVGTFAILLAPYAGQVIAIEESPSAVKDAEINAEGIDNIRFIQGKTEEVLDQIEVQPQGVILDPPRAGCRPNALEALCRLAPRRVVYVSCDPETLARDLKLLCQSTFGLERVQPVDMFPQTHHVECVVTLARRSPSYQMGKADVHPQEAASAEITLASTSPRRRELLSHLGLDFRVVPPLVDEQMVVGETPQKMVERLALSKAVSVARSLPTGLVMGADSVVVVDGRAVGKPADATEARSVLEGLRDREHLVVTGVALVDAGTGREWASIKSTSVMMRRYSDLEIDAYVASGAPLDKAGSYGVQDADFNPAAWVDGCYTNVMGLPLCTVVDLLKEAGCQTEPAQDMQITGGCSQCPLRASR